MEKNRFRVNNKEKQFRGGNWGKPNETEQKNSNPSNSLYPNKIKNKQKKRTKKTYIPERDLCPFCKEILPIDEKEKQRQIAENEKTREEGYVRYLVEIFTPRVKICPNCGAEQVEECPCCHKDTWFKDEIYKHQGRLGCGFVGKKKKTQ